MLDVNLGGINRKTAGNGGSKGFQASGMLPALPVEKLLEELIQ